MALLAPLLLAASRSAAARTVVSGAPPTRRVVERFVAGEGPDDALRATRALAADGLAVTIDHLGEDTTDVASARAVADAYVALLTRLGHAGLADDAEVSVKASALGAGLDPTLALDLAAQVCSAAESVGTTVTVDMEGSATVDATLALVADLRTRYPWVGAVLQSMLHRTEADCRDLAVAGSRVRLVKGAYAEPAAVAHQAKADVDAAYERCLRILLDGPGYPMIGTHDPRMITAATQFAAAAGRAADSWELQMLYGIRTDEQRRLAAQGRRVRVYLPYGTDWYGYFMRRLAERPANVAFFLRSFVPQSLTRRSPTS